MQVFEYSDFCLVDNLVLDEKSLLKNINLADSVYLITIIVMPFAALRHKWETKTVCSWAALFCIINDKGR